ncbi:MAG: hypothetical protein MJ053_02320 [Elusimicrobiaceae bacterium]|nr:hypothetical protein [Elusimicrobiaceae bacterium]
MKKWLALLLPGMWIWLAGCSSSPYNRTDEKESYERFINRHIFAVCANAGKPYAQYSLARQRRHPTNSDYYKVTFISGPCKNQTIWTKHVIVKTEPISTQELPLGTLVLRNYDNPPQLDKDKTEKWHVGVVSSTARQKKGIIDLEFPRDSHDFNPAREAVYVHNVRYIKAPKLTDVRTFIH